MEDLAEQMNFTAVAYAYVCGVQFLGKPVGFVGQTNLYTCTCTPSIFN